MEGLIIWPFTRHNPSVLYTGGFTYIILMALSTFRAIWIWQDSPTPLEEQVARKLGIKVERLVLGRKRRLDRYLDIKTMTREEFDQTMVIVLGTYVKR